MDKNIIIVFHVSESKEVVRLMGSSDFQNMKCDDIISKLLSDYSISIDNPILYFSNITFSFPIPPNVKPLDTFPQLVLINNNRAVLADIHKLIRHLAEQPP